MPFRILQTQRDNTVSAIASRGWLTIIGCVNGHSRSLTGPELLERFPLDATIGQIADRLKCSTCGSSDGEVGFVQDQSEAARRRMGRRKAGPPNVYKR